ncbi:MAG: hypothetical protein GY811_22105 [Myxococcales bacterium]|nr:hypothetical protein [Myxococcales bacterium]
MITRPLLIQTILLSAVGCDSSSGGDKADAQEESLAAVSYCEAIAPSFCDFYLRCGRMDVTTQEGCESNFLESCNSKYEGAYVELETLGFLELSSDGIAACERHLETVDCAQQVFELTGPCADIWAGQQSIGETCGLDAEFFTCDESSECVLSPDFCGTCKELVAIGDACIPVEQTCGSEAFCNDGLCKARKKNGEACGDEDRCGPGSSCSNGSCTGPAFVGRGDACDRANRCPYLTECISGRCEAAVLQGEACDETTTCATGYCDQGTCVPPQANGSACTGASQCRSLLCGDGQCQPRPSTCMQ